MMVGDDDYLMLHQLPVKQHRRLGIIRFDAAHIVRLLGVDGLHQRQHRVLEQCPGSQGSLGGLGDVLCSLRPHHLQEAVLGVEQESLEVLEQRVSVLLNEPGDGVDHVPGVVLDQEVLAVAQQLVHGVSPAGGVVLVRLQLPVHLLQQQLIRHLANIEAGLVHQRDHPLVLLLYQLADDHVVEVLDVLPLDAFSLVLLLLLLQHQLYHEYMTLGASCLQI